MVAGARGGVVERQRAHAVVERCGVAEAVRAEHLVVGEPERAAHPVLADLPGVDLVPLAAARVAPGEVRDERAAPPGLPAAVGARDNGPEKAAFRAAAYRRCSRSACLRRRAGPPFRSAATYRAATASSLPTISAK